MGIIERGYADIVPPVPPFSEVVRYKVLVIVVPFPKVIMIQFSLCREIIPLDELCIPLVAYVESIRSWCGFQNYVQVNGEDAGNKILEDIQEKYNHSSSI